MDSVWNHIGTSCKQQITQRRGIGLVLFQNIFSVIFLAVVGVQTFGSDSSDPTQPMSFPNYSDPLVANWSIGRDSITLTPTIFDSAVLGEYA